MTFPANDNEFYEVEIIKVEPRGDGGYCIQQKNGAYFGGIDPNPAIIPTKGMTARFYSKGMFCHIRGLYIDGVQIFYRSPAEQEAKNLDDAAESRRKRMAEFEENRAKLDASYDALPDDFKRRIDKFRTNNPDFRWEYESYEMFCCEQAVLIAASLRTPDAVRAFHKRPWEEQLKAVPGLSDGHSGNTFGCACSLAIQHLSQPENVVKMHGAMAPLVGSEAYGCVARA